MSHQVRTERAGLRSYAAALTQGQEEERAGLARELHDETVQTLIALEHRVHLLRRAIALDSEVASQKVTEQAEITASAIQDLRRVIHNLRPLYLDDLGWMPAVRALVEDLKRNPHLEVILDIQGPESRLEPAIELALYRIAQEALRNVARHSQAKTAHVSLHSGARGSAITIEDDGQGFIVPARFEELAQRGHFGLMGMMERAERVGARFHVKLILEKGTTIKITICKEKTLAEKDTHRYTAGETLAALENGE